MINAQITYYLFVTMQMISLVPSPLTQKGLGTRLADDEPGARACKISATVTEVAKSPPCCEPHQELSPKIYQHL